MKRVVPFAAVAVLILSVTASVNVMRPGVASPARTVDRTSVHSPDLAQAVEARKSMCFAKGGFQSTDLYAKRTASSLRTNLLRFSLV